MRVLITGSSGQIGTNLALRLMERGDDVFGIDRRKNTWTDQIPAVTADLTVGAPGELPVRGAFDCVVHMAAHAKVFELVENPRRAMENMQMAFNVLEYCRVNKTPIVFASSREVYGDIKRHITVESEADFVVAESPYSASKIAAEAYIYSYAECYGLPCLVFRFSNVYGRFDNDLERMERVTPLFIQRIANRLPIVIHGKEKVLDFTYIDDCVQGIYLGIQKLLRREVMNQTINLAYGRGNTLVKLAELIGGEFGVAPQISYTPSQSGEVTHYVADIGKARNLLGYSPQTPLEAGIPKAVAWSRNHAKTAAPA